MEQLAGMINDEIIQQKTSLLSMLETTRFSKRHISLLPSALINSQQRWKQPRPADVCDWSQISSESSSGSGSSSGRLEECGG